MADQKLKHFSEIPCIFLHRIIYFYLHTQMSFMCLQMRRPGCWGFQENHLLQQSGHSQHIVETAKQTQIFLVFHTHWDLTDKTGDRTEIVLPSSEVSTNFGFILVQWAHTERTFWRLFYMWKSARNLPLWLFQKVISHERQKHFRIYIKTSCLKNSESNKTLQPSKVDLSLVQ